MSASKKQTVAEKLDQLEGLLEWFESDDMTVEAAIEKYEAALKLAGEIETDLSQAKNQIQIIKQKFSV